MKEPFDQQINFLNYLQCKKYPFSSPLKNPLLPLSSSSPSWIQLPTSSSFPDRNICTECITDTIKSPDKRPVNCIKMFQNSKKLLFGTTNGSLVTCDIYNSFSLTNSFQLTPQTAFRALQFTKKESYIVTGDGSGKVTYFTYPIKKLKEFFPHTATITDIAFSINDQKFITSSDDKTSKIIDFYSGNADISFKGHLSDVKSCDWNPYKNLVVSGGKDHIIKIWDPSSGEEIATLHAHNDSINRLRFNKNGNWLLSASKDHTLKVTDIRVMKEIQSFKGHDKEVNTVCWHPVNEEIFCSAGIDKSIIYWKVGQYKNYTVRNAHDKEIFDLCFNNTGTLLASASNDMSLKFWKRKNGKETNA